MKLWEIMYLHVLHRVLVTGGTLDLCSKKKSISGAVRPREDSEACSEGVTGLVEAAEPTTGSMLVEEIGRCTCCTSSSADCSSKGVKSVKVFSRTGIFTRVDWCCSTASCRTRCWLLCWSSASTSGHCGSWVIYSNRIVV